MATDNKNDTTPSKNQQIPAGETVAKAGEKAIDKAAEKVIDSSSKSSSKSEPPVLSDTVSSASLSSPAATVKPDAMVDSNAETTPEPKKKPAAQSSASQPPAAAGKAKKSGSGIGWLALLIALLALAGVAYGLWMSQQEKHNGGAQQERISQTQSQLVESVKSSTQALSSQVQGVLSKSENQQQRLTELQTQLQATNRQIGEVTQVNRRSWMLAEAEYLLRLANQRLLMERETASALALLNSADQILLTVAEPGLFEVRETLARETAALRAVAHVDVEGVFVKLSALGQQVESLALLTPASGTDVAEVLADEAPGNEQQGVFAATLEHFNKMVVVRRRDEPLTPLLTPEQHYYVQQNLRLMLEQAQLALLQRRPGVYTGSLEKAANWVDEYFQLNETAQALLVSLRELQQVDVDPQLPDISASLALLKGYLSNSASSAQAQPITPQPEAGKAAEQREAESAVQSPVGSAVEGDAQ